VTRSTRTDEAVENPQLRALVELARAQRPPELRVTIEDVWRRGDAQRARGRGWIVAGAVAMAAGLAAFIAMSPGDAELVEAEAAPAQASKVVEPAVESGQAPEREDDRSEIAKHDPIEPETSPIPEPEPEPELALAEGVVFEPLGDAAPASILSRWSVEVAAGRYRVETPAGGAVLEIFVGPRITRIEPGSKLTFDASRGHGVEVEEPTAGELAQQAEHAMAEGRRGDAIRALTKLVRRHPQSAQARAGLVDLARLHKSDGAWDRARCAYQLYLDRFPSASLRPEVERALYKLGEGKACNGLAPK
jgi:hypothetical protein